MSQKPIPCDCMDKLFKHYDAEFKGGICFTNSATLCNMKTGETRVAPPPLRFKRYKLGKNGEPTKKTINNFISPNYCQFCGVKL